MDEALALFSDRLSVRERSTPDALSSESAAAAWEQFQKDWKSAVVYENFLMDLADQISARCELELIDEYVKVGTALTDFQGYSAPATMVNWNGYWESPLTRGSALYYPNLAFDDRGLTSQDFLERLPKHLNEIADRFVTFVKENNWTVCAKLEIPAGYASNSRWIAPLRLIRNYVVDRDIFVARFDMIGAATRV